MGYFSFPLYRLYTVLFLDSIKFVFAMTIVFFFARTKSKQDKKTTNKILPDKETQSQNEYRNWKLKSKEKYNRGTERESESEKKLAQNKIKKNYLQTNY